MLNVMMEIVALTWRFSEPGVVEAGNSHNARVTPEQQS